MFEGLLEHLRNAVSHIYKVKSTRCFLKVVELKAKYALRILQKPDIKRPFFHSHKGLFISNHDRACRESGKHCVGIINSQTAS